MALVLIAVAAEGLEQNDQALKAYKRAITADESQLLAWQAWLVFSVDQTFLFFAHMSITCSR